MGRLTADPEMRQTPQGTSVARFTIAVNRRFQREGGQQADFIRCVAFGRSAEFAEKYLHQGIKIAITGRIQTGSYTRNDGTRVYTTDVVVEDQEFAESKNASQNGGNTGWQPAAAAPAAPASPSNQEEELSADGFMNIPDGIDEELPFH